MREKIACTYNNRNTKIMNRKGGRERPKFLVIDKLIKKKYFNGNYKMFYLIWFTVLFVPQFFNRRPLSLDTISTKTHQVPWKNTRNTDNENSSMFMEMNSKKGLYFFVNSNQKRNSNTVLYLLPARLQFLCIKKIFYPNCQNCTFKKGSNF